MARGFFMKLKKETLRGGNSIPKPDVWHQAAPDNVLEYYKMFGLCEQDLNQILVNPCMEKCFGKPPVKPTIKRR